MKLKSKNKEKNGWEAYYGFHSVHWHNGYADKVEVGGKIFIATKARKLRGK